MSRSKASTIAVLSLSVANTDRENRGERRNDGVWQALWPFGDRQVLPRPRHLFNGSHSGCIERRQGLRNANLFAGLGTNRKACEFDGRLPLVYHRKQWLLFARANPTASGHRFVQVTSSSDSMRTWMPFN